MKEDASGEGSGGVHTLKRIMCLMSARVRSDLR